MFIYLIKRQNPSFGLQKIKMAVPIMGLSIRHMIPHRGLGLVQVSLVIALPATE